MQGRGPISDLGVEDNLRAGALIGDDHEVAADLRRWWNPPAAGWAKEATAGELLPGGEQQVLPMTRGR